MSSRRNKKTRRGGDSINSKKYKKSVLHKILEVKDPDLSSYPEHTIRTKESISLTLSILADGFAEIEAYGNRVGKMKIHPSLRERSFAEFNGFKRGEVWGAEMEKDPDLPKNCILMLGRKDPSILDDFRSPVLAVVLSW